MSRVKFNIGQDVYLKTDTDQHKRIVTGYIVRDFGVVYLITHETDENEHYECEISIEQDILIKTSN